MPILNNPVPVIVTTDDFDNLGQKLTEEMGKDKYSSAAPYATTFSANNDQTQVLDALNSVLDSYFKKN